jgi:hypothetical protein
MAEWLKLLVYALRSRFKSRARLEADNLVLRQQIDILIRKLRKCMQLALLRSTGSWWRPRFFKLLCLPKTPKAVKTLGF